MSEAGHPSEVSSNTDQTVSQDCKSVISGRESALFSCAGELTRSVERAFVETAGLTVMTMPATLET